MKKRSNEPNETRRINVAKCLCEGVMKYTADSFPICICDHCKKKGFYCEFNNENRCAIQMKWAMIILPKLFSYNV